MSKTDQLVPSDWKAIVNDLYGDEFRSDPVRFLESKNIKIHSTLLGQVERLKNVEMDESKKKMWDALRALAGGNLTSEEQRVMICTVAEIYREFVGWEGNTNEEPGW